MEQRYGAFEKAKNYTKQYELDKIDSIVTRQEDDMLGYISAGQFATTGSNIFTDGQIILGNLTIDGDIFANQFIVTTSSVNHFTASTNFGVDMGDTHTFTGSVRITGSLNTIGTTTMTGSLLVSGSTTQIGNNTLLGNTTLSGSVSVSGALDIHGSTNFHNHTITMTGSMYTSGSQQITGSLDIKGNINVASGSEFYLAGNKLFNYGQFSDTTTQSGSANTAYAKKLNTTDFAHNVSIVDGTKIKVDNTGIYNLQFSTQLANSANTNITFDIWLAYTGSNVANSNTQIDVNKSAGQLGRSVAAWNFMLPIQANDYVELMWSCNAATGQLAAMGTQTTPNRPAVPSVIATLTQIG
jgi:cytoskeletal protein CcmA (bactofilin family)